MGATEANLYLKGMNLTDAEARVHTSFLKDIAPLGGRGVMCGVQWTF
jgi:iron complex outermembrane receptor protein